VRRSNFAKYKEERENALVVEDENGFATAIFLEDAVYIDEIYVIPEKRKSNIASNYANQIAEKAKKLGYHKLLGSVCPSAKGATTSLKVLLAYGFELHSTNSELIYLEKEI